MQNWQQSERQLYGLHYVAPEVQMTKRVDSQKRDGHTRYNRYGTRNNDTLPLGKVYFGETL